LRKFSL